MQKFRNLTLSSKFTLPTAIAGAVIVILVVTALILVKQRNTTLAGLSTAESVANQIVTLRTYYTTQVLPRAKAAGMEAHYDFENRDNTLPLPATFTRSLGEQIAEDFPGMSVRLYSRFPFPHREGLEDYDDFEMYAIGELEKDSETPVYRMVSYLVIVLCCSLRCSASQCNRVGFAAKTALGRQSRPP